MSILTRTRSIRVRLTLWYSVVLLAGVVLIESSVWLAMRRELSAELDRAISNRVTGIEKYLRIELIENAGSLKEELDEIARSLPPDYRMEARGPSGEVLYVSRQWREIFAVGAPYRILRNRVNIANGVYAITIAAGTSQMTSVLRTLAVLSLLAVPVVVLFAALGGYWLSTRALSPVDAMTRAVGAIGIQNLSARLPVPPSGDEIARLASTWNDMLARLETAVRRIVEFTSDASHELRTPVAFIRSTAEIAQRRPRTEAEYRCALRDIELESERMTRLVEDLLFLARADALAPRTWPLDLRDAVAEACAEVAPLAEIRNVRVIVNPAREGLEVTGDESALRRMMVALLDNAIKYSPTGGSVTVRGERVNGHASIRVRDHGIGIPPEALPHIFERFYRADPARARDSGGYGLGLAIARTIARQHAGEIQVESGPDLGSTFHVSVPLSTT